MTAVTWEPCGDYKDEDASDLEAGRGLHDHHGLDGSEAGGPHLVLVHQQWHQHCLRYLHHTTPTHHWGVILIIHTQLQYTNTDSCGSVMPLIYLLVMVVCLIGCLISSPRLAMCQQSSMMNWESAWCAISTSLTGGAGAFETMLLCLHATWASEATTNKAHSDAMLAGNAVLHCHSSVKTKICWQEPLMLPSAALTCGRVGTPDTAALGTKRAGCWLL